jgi:hypothetical protein
MSERIRRKFAGFRVEFSLPDSLKMSDAAMQALLRARRGISKI